MRHIVGVATGDGYWLAQVVIVAIIIPWKHLPNILISISHIKIIEFPFGLLL